MNAIFASWRSLVHANKVDFSGIKQFIENVLKFLPTKPDDRLRQNALLNRRSDYTSVVPMKLELSLAL